MTARIFTTPAQGVELPPTGRFVDIAREDVSQFSQIRVFADNNVQANSVIIDLSILEGGLLLALDQFIVKGARSVTNTYDAPGTTLMIQAAVIGGGPSTIHVVVYGIP